MKVRSSRVLIVSGNNVSNRFCPISSVKFFQLLEFLDERFVLIL